MWRINRAEIVNFKSYDEAAFDIRNNQTTLVYGKNLDEYGSDSNGSGKSALLSAITVGLIGLFDKDVTKDDYIKDGKKSCSIKLFMANEATKETMVVERKIYRTKSAELTIEENNEKNDLLTTAANTDQRILEKIGIAKEDILNFFLINQENENSFFNSTDMQKKVVISRFINVDKLDLIVEDLDIKVKEQQNLRFEIDVMVGSINGAIEEINNNINNSEEDFKVQKKEGIATLENLIKACKGKEDSLLLRIDKRKEETGILREQMAELSKNVDHTKFENNSTIVQKKIDSRRSQQEYLEKSISKLNLAISSKMVCPKCKHSWLVTLPDLSISEAVKLKKAQDEQYKKLKDELLSLKFKYVKYSEKILEAKQNKSKVRTKAERELEITKELIGFSEELLAVKKEQKTYLVDLISLKKQKYDKKVVGKLRKRLLEKQTELKEAESFYEAVDNELERLAFWKFHFGLTGYKSYLINKVLKNIEGYVNLYLKKFKTDLAVQINGYKTLKSGKLSEKIDVLVSKDGENWKNFKRFSGGQKQRVNVCGIITLQSLINRTAVDKGGGLDFLGLDEFFEGLDRMGQERVLRILRLSNITTLMISHNNNDIGWDNKIVVEYKNKNSKIIEQ